MASILGFESGWPGIAKRPLRSGFSFLGSEFYLLNKGFFFLVSGLSFLVSRFYLWGSRFSSLL